MGFHTSRVLLRLPARSPMGAAVLATALLLTGLLCAPVQGQQAGPPLTLEVSASDGSVTAVLGPVLAPRGIRSSLEAGLPVRIRVVTELWRDRFFDEQVGRSEWRASVHYDPLARSYEIRVGDDPPLTASSVEAAGSLLAELLEVPLRPTRPGRYYYLARIEVETLSLSDLGELRRWLQGDVAPVTEGEGGVGSALGRGLQRLLIRVLGLPAERFQARSRAFEFPG